MTGRKRNWTGLGQGKSRISAGPWEPPAGRAPPAPWSRAGDQGVGKAPAGGSWRNFTFPVELPDVAITGEAAVGASRQHGSTGVA